MAGGAICRILEEFMVMEIKVMDMFTNVKTLSFAMVQYIAIKF